MATAPPGALHMTTVPSPVDELRLFASGRGLRAILWQRHEARRVPFDGAMIVDGETDILREAARQLGEYFAGRREEFDLPLDPVGTPFQHEAWAVLRTIPFGATMTYGEQAKLLGDPGKARAVGAANGRNPLSIVVPCHRVIGSTGKLTGFAGGLDVKAWLLTHEHTRATGHHPTEHRAAT
ncbi:MAG: ogt [Ilumatobacteraceae bacterium]|nr:ogt [Ilumatobacteraceae bacterium]